MGGKWSDSSKEGKLLKRIMTRLDKREKKMDDNMDLDTLMDFAKAVAYVAEKKSNLAKNADWEKRIKILEKAAMMSKPMPAQ